MGQGPSKADPEGKGTGEAPPNGTVTEPVFLAGDVHLAEASEGTQSPQVTQQSLQPPAAAAPPSQPPSQQPTPAPAPRPREGKIEAIADYKIMRTLGQGAYGKVKLASNVNNGHNVAVKVIDRSKLVDRPQGTQQLAREINTMKILRHQNVVRLYEVIHTPAKIFMVMEYATQRVECSVLCHQAAACQPATPGHGGTTPVADPERSPTGRFAGACPARLLPSLGHCHLCRPRAATSSRTSTQTGGFPRRALPSSLEACSRGSTSATNSASATETSSSRTCCSSTRARSRLPTLVRRRPLPPHVFAMMHSQAHS